jgi:hypothetical protein
MWDLVVNNVALERVLFEYLRFPYQFSFHQLLHIHPSPEVIQTDPRAIVSILGGHSIGHSMEKEV